MATALPAFQFTLPTRLVFGHGCVKGLPQLVEEVGGPAARPLLVVGQKSLRSSGIFDRLMGELRPHRPVVYEGVEAFPPPETVDKVTAICRQERCNVVVGVGGGSVLDVAKGAAILATHQGAAREFFGGKGRLVERGLPVIAAPTTSGSSSEVTPYVVFWDISANKSFNLSHPSLFPTVALVDPDLTLTMPPLLAVTTGMDALTSSFEAYWATTANPFTDVVALEVIRLFVNNLERSCLQGDPEARAACHLAATLSAIAYTVSRANICHALARPMTAYWQVAHGQAVGITLPVFLEWLGPALGPRLSPLLSPLGVASAGEGARRLAGLMRRCGLATRIGELGIGRDGVEVILKEAAWERTATVPRPMGPEDVRPLLEAIL